MNVTSTNSSAPLLSNADNHNNNAFPGDNFSNNLFTDLAPLLALFGEQMTKQFLSMSLGWADNLLLGMAPVGILTVVISAIRIGGTRSLKAIIGRARESKAAAELELLCSTSEEVCELWSGTEIVRVAGEPDMAQYILDPRSTTRKIMTTSYAVSKGIYERRLRGHSESTTSLGLSEAHTHGSGAPNITLNVRGAMCPAWELRILVMFGFIIQSLVFAISALATYRWQWTSGSQMLSTYGYPCFVIGSIALSGGVVACSRVIQGSTIVEELIPSESNSMPAFYQPFRVQKACTVDAKHFPSFAIFNAPEEPVLRTSRTNGEDFSGVTAVSAGIAITGFICQFIGLRAMHWSVAIMQLVAMVIMTCARAFVRRGLAFQPRCEELPVGNEAAGLAYVLAGMKSWEFVTGVHTEQDVGLPRIRTIISEHCLPSKAKVPASVLADCHAFVRSTYSIREIMSNTDEISLIASQVTSCMGTILAMVSEYRANGLIDYRGSDPGLSHTWKVRVASLKNDDTLQSPTLDLTFPRPPDQTTTLAFDATGFGSFFIDHETLGAILSLWLVTLKTRYEPYAGRIRDDERPEEGCLRIVNNHLAPEPTTIQKWLMPDTRILETCMPLGTSSVLPEIHIESSLLDQLQKAPVFGIAYSSLYDRRHFERMKQLTSEKDPDAWLLAEYPNEASIDPSESSTKTFRLLGASARSDLYFHQSATRERTKDNDFAAIRGLNLREMRTLLNKDFRTTTQKTELAVISSASLEKNCALEFFSIFLLSLTGGIQRIGGKTVEIHTEGTQVQWKNSIIYELANAVVDSGLAANQAEALTVIVPAFAARGLLPDRLSD